MPEMNTWIAEYLLEGQRRILPEISPSPSEPALTSTPRYGVLDKGGPRGPVRLPGQGQSTRHAESHILDLRKE